MSRHGRAVWSAGGVLLLALLFMPCTGGAQEASPSTPTTDKEQPATEPAAESVTESATQPEFKPGIPGLKMVDVRDHKHLWRALEELQAWEEGDRLSVAEYRLKSIEKTSQFLGLREAAAERFAATSAEAVAAIREAFHKGRQGAEPGQRAASFSAELRTIVARVTAVLGEEPRQRLFEPECKKWLLQLAFGPREAKETREARQAQVATSVKPSQTDK